MVDTKGEECGEHYSHIQQVECFRPTGGEKRAKRSKQKQEAKRQRAAAFQEQRGLLVHIKKCFKKLFACQNVSDELRFHLDL